MKSTVLLWFTSKVLILNAFNRNNVFTLVVFNFLHDVLDFTVQKDFKKSPLDIFGKVFWSASFCHNLD